MLSEIRSIRMMFLEIQVLWVWDMEMCHWAHGSVHYEEMYSLHLRWFSRLLDPEDEGTTFLWHVRNHPPNDNTSHSCRPESSGRSEDDDLLIHDATPDTQCHTWYTMPHLLIPEPWTRDFSFPMSFTTRLGVSSHLLRNLLTISHINSYTWMT